MSKPKAAERKWWIEKLWIPILLIAIVGVGKVIYDRFIKTGSQKATQIAIQQGNNSSSTISGSSNTTQASISELANISVTGTNVAIVRDSPASSVNSPGAINLNNSPGALVNSPNSTSVVTVPKLPSRHLSLNQEQKLLSFLTNQSSWPQRTNTEIVVQTVEADSETKSYASQLRRFFVQCKFPVRERMLTARYNYPSSPPGIYFLLRDSSTAPPLAWALLPAFMSAGISARGTTNVPPVYGTNRLIILVGPNE